ncbi:hypothetical protein SNOG_08665 [Parastagonospora nodorum SN15]|uniref:Elongator complex protein 4 n=1 Tax=Phaeosphaeria nodorum (strain SN15 / ATCC MYA-4574 / FGSC 10173) TaxID=321614 RepID=Q0UHU9_PHANO|nr:hypothetical protein SNOG_08665 [Parastagonospora nodorum SN15]EAT83833.2 hypothetical protein SNOG_08665 [Parastagonospora nodorum SN15]
MAFRKRNVALARAPAGSDATDVPSSPTSTSPAATIPGVRPSPIDGRPTTSTGTPSLDSILAGHAGLPLGNSILIEESGTTDYAGALLRFYAAEGVVQGHKVHVVGMGEMWGRELPGITEDRGDRRKESKERAEKMKIAWRYEGLGQFESSRAQSAGTTKDEERPQGMFAVHKLPVFHEKGGGGGADDLGEDMAFTLSRRKFVVAKFSLPPLEGDTEAQEQAVREAAGGSAMPKKADLEF